MVGRMHGACLETQPAVQEVAQLHNTRGERSACISDACSYPASWLLAIVSCSGASYPPGLSMCRTFSPSPSLFERPLHSFWGPEPSSLSAQVEEKAPEKKKQWPAASPELLSPPRLRERQFDVEM